VRLRSLAFLTAVVLIGSLYGMGQFLPNYAQFDNGVNLAYFLPADINRDGHGDVVGIRSPAANTVELTVLLGNGTGGFGAPLNTTITGIDRVCVGPFLLQDFNGDGRLDVAVSGLDHITGQSVVAVMLGNGDWTFEAPRETAGESFPCQLVQNGPPGATAGDFNGDGKLDIAYPAGNNNVVVLPGKGDGTFSSPLTTTFPGNVNLMGITAGDFNNDKKLDLVISNQFGEVSVLSGNGNGTFQSPKQVGNGGLYGRLLGVADLNGDGNLDLIVCSYLEVLGGQTTIFLGDGTGMFPTMHVYSDGLGPVTQFQVKDLNGDGHPDIALLLNNNIAPTVLSTLLNNGDGSFTPGKTYNGDGKSPDVGLLVTDVNGSGKLDLVFGNGAGGVSVLLGNGNGTFKGNFVSGATLGGQTILGGDFNGDLKPDLIEMPSGTPSNSNGLLLGNGDGTFTLKTNTACPYDFHTMAIGDFNHDGKLDLAGATGTTGPVAVCLGNGNGTFKDAGFTDQQISHGLVMPGDFNNDGKPDLVASDQNGISILLGNGDGSFQNGIPTAVSVSFPTFTVADFNNDGKLDIAALTSAGVAVFLGKGNGMFQAPIVSPGPASGFLTVADLNKDGKRDLIVANTAAVTVLLGKGNGAFLAPVHYAVKAATRAVIADFNGDGNLDVAVGSTGQTIDILLGNGLGKLSLPTTTFRVGSPARGIVTGLFNADKKPDLAVLLGDAVVTLLHQ